VSDLRGSFWRRVMEAPLATLSRACSILLEHPNGYAHSK
jgi:hypothetical protein